MKKMLIIMLISSLLTACADWPETVEELQSKPAGTKVFSSMKNYEQVYRLALKMSSKCYSKGGFYTAGVLELEKRRGEITVGLYANELPRHAQEVPPTILMHIDVKSDNGGSILTVVYASPKWQNNADLLNSWVNENDTSCP